MSQTISSERLQQLQARAASLSHQQKPRLWRGPLKVRSLSRVHLNLYWGEIWNHIRHGHIHRINPFRLGINLLRDVKLYTAFNLNMLGGYHR